MGLPWNMSDVDYNVKPGPISSPIYLDNVRCKGNELNIFECPRNISS